MPDTELSQVQITSNIMANYNLPSGLSIISSLPPPSIFYLSLFIAQFQ